MDGQAASPGRAGPSSCLCSFICPGQCGLSCQHPQLGESGPTRPELAPPSGRAGPRAGEGWVLAQSLRLVYPSEAERPRHGARVTASTSERSPPCPSCVPGPAVGSQFLWLLVPMLTPKHMARTPSSCGHLLCMSWLRPSGTGCTVPGAGAAGCHCLLAGWMGGPQLVLRGEASQHRAGPVK